MVLNMHRWSGSSPLGKKGQFFVISVAIIAASLASIMNMLEVHREMNLPEFHRHEEDRLFQNVKEGINKTTRTSNCNLSRKRNLKDFKKMTEKNVVGKGGHLNITYYDYCPDVDVSVEMKFPQFEMKDRYVIP